jgi:hypothetical protein
MRSQVQVLETGSCRNAGKCCVRKIQSDRTLPRTLCKLELHPGCHFLKILTSYEAPDPWIPGTGGVINGAYCTPDVEVDMLVCI